MKLLKYHVLLASLIIGQATARAEIAIDFGNYSLRTDQQTTFGWSFTLSAPILVTSLGYFDFQNDGLTDAHPVAIWTSAGGTPLILATVPSGTTGTLLNGTRYMPITPTMLAAGTYTIGGYSPAFTDSVAVENAIISTAPGIAYNGSRSAQGMGLMFPSGNTQGYANGDFGPNFQFDAVPEPSVAVFLLVGGIAVALRHRRNCRNAS